MEDVGDKWNGIIISSCLCALHVCAMSCTHIYEGMLGVQDAALSVRACVRLLALCGLTNFVGRQLPHYKLL